MTRTNDMTVDLVSSARANEDASKASKASNKVKVKEETVSAPSPNLSLAPHIELWPRSGSRYCGSDDGGDLGPIERLKDEATLPQ